MDVSFITEIPQLDGLHQFFSLKKEQDKGVLGWDIETTPLKDFFYRRCRTVQFGDTNRQFVIDLLPFVDNDPVALFDVQGNYGKKLPAKLKQLLTGLEPILCTNDYLKVGVNLSFEYQMFYWLFGLRTWNFYDCSMAEKCIWAGAHSMKDYGFYSMSSMMERYLRKTVDKQYQESFTLDAQLEQGQIDYAALDTRFPLVIRSCQQLITSGRSLSTLRNEKEVYSKFFDLLEPKKTGTTEPIILGDNLDEIVSIENDAIGAFEDMHIHGERIDRDKWKARIAKKKEKLKVLIADTLDPYFIPFVGDKSNNATDEQIEAAENIWKSYNEVSAEELELKAQIRGINKAIKSAQSTLDPEWLDGIKLRDELQQKIDALAEKRKADKEIYKTAASNMKKQRTKVKNLAEKCEGNALINYGSDTQILAVLKQMKGLSTISKMDDETLEKFAQKGHLVCEALRELHTLQKEIGTYGDQWAEEWTTKPCKEEGWLNPGDGRLHCVFNQYDAETGRSSSEKPNGQNLPQDKEVRSCFIADPPDENIRISNCCDADTLFMCGDRYGSEDPLADDEWYRCTGCGKDIDYSETHAEEYVIVTADMSGAELRIIAELAEDPVWIGAFNRGEDVHSVGTEILHEENWETKTLRSKLFEKWTLDHVKSKSEVVLEVLKDDGKVKKIGPCAYYAIKDNGEFARQKCDCPEHGELRNDNKSTNFLLAYGGGPSTLALAIKKSLDKAKELMALHAKKFPRIWAYLDKSGKDARMLKRSFDMFGRRRLFPEPTWDRARLKVIADYEEKLRLPEDVAESKIAAYVVQFGEKPKGEDLYNLTHRKPTNYECGSAMAAMSGTIERQGKNHAIQGTNSTIIKKAMGCGFDPNGKPYLWHTLPQYKAKLIKMVHDELVLQCPKRFGKIVAGLIGDAFKRAAAEKMSKVVMEFDYNIGSAWEK